MIAIPNATHLLPVILSLSLLSGPGGRRGKDYKSKHYIIHYPDRSGLVRGKGEGEGAPSDGGSDRGTEPENGCAMPHWFR